MIVTNFSVKHRVAVFVLMGGLALLGTSPIKIGEARTG